MVITFSTTSVAKHDESSKKNIILYDVSRHEFSNQHEIVTYRHVTSRETRNIYASVETSPTSR